ncbi:MAG: GTPase ObgE [Oscillospiraceae bacterium]
MFIDKAKIFIKAGNGGNGVVSFHTEKYVSAGGPDGGDGGKGGDVVFVVDDNLSTLVDFRYKRRFVAPNGDNGGQNKCSGRGGKDIVIKVPRGTLVKDAKTGRIVADLSKNESQILAKGGKGGAGNQHFATATRQIPRYAKPGRLGEEIELQLELKLLADVGLVGFPNVGKSTLISVVSAAKPTIANYHFTTLSPVLGVVSLGEGNSFVMADIPGLIEGASDGVGLGHDFLRHVERCRLILHIVDVSGSEARDPKEDFMAINKELANFSEELAERPQMVVANKCDMATDEQISEFKEFVEEKGYDFFQISAATTSGTKPLVNAIGQKIKTLPPIKEYEAQPLTPEEILENQHKNEFEITKEDGIFYVDAPFLEQIMLTVNPNDYESLQYFERVIKNNGIIAKLEEMGADEGDVVSINNFEFDYVK